MRCGASPAMLSPARLIVPRSGGWMPVMRLTSVVLPAPFGPMRPRISPAPIVRATSLVATSPPKRLVSPTVSSSAISGVPRLLAEQAGRADQQDEEDEDEAIGVLIGRS